MQYKVQKLLHSKIHIKLICNNRYFGIICASKPKPARFSRPSAPSLSYSAIWKWRTNTHLTFLDMKRIESFRFASNILQANGFSGIGTVGTMILFDFVQNLTSTKLVVIIYHWHIITHLTVLLRISLKLHHRKCISGGIIMKFNSETHKNRFKHILLKTKSALIKRGIKILLHNDFNK